MESDAIEGLTQFKNKKDPLLFAEELNRHLQKQLQKKKSAKEKHRIKDMPWLYFTIILIVIIILIGFFVVWEYLK
jgi:Na+/H+ antiporter NhaD/arsenite permease-like protein